MTRFAIDAPIAVRLIRDGRAVGSGHRLVAPSGLRSEVLGLLLDDVRAGRLDERAGRAQLEVLAGLKIRLLGDRVSRSVAWRIALQHGLDDATLAEYIAVGQLQADALVTDDPALRAAAAGIVPFAGYGALFD